MAKSVYLQTLTEKIKTGKYVIELKRYRKQKDTYRVKEGVSDYVLDVDLSPYPTRVREDVHYLENMSLKDKEDLAKKHDTTLQEVELAIDEKITSLRNSLTKSGGDVDDSNYVYDWYLKQNKETGDIYITAKVLEETEHVSAEYKPKKSKPKTLIKENISKRLSTEIKRFKIPLANLDSIKLKLK